MKPLTAFVTGFLSVFSLISCGKKVANLPDNPPLEDTVSEWTILNTTNSPLPSNQVNTIHIDHQNTRWIGTANGLVRIKEQDWTIFNTSNSKLLSNHIICITVDLEGTTWIGTSAGLFSFAGNDWQLYSTENSPLPVNEIMCLATDLKTGVTWAGTSEGLLRIDRAGMSLEERTAGKTVHALFVDAQSVLWVGAFDHFPFQGRIYKYDGTTWSRYDLDKFGYTSTFPYQISVGSDGSPVILLSGTSVSEIVKLENGNFSVIPRPDRTPGVRALAMQQEKIWVAGKALYLLGVPDPKTIAMPLIDPLVLDMDVDKSGRKWMASGSGGLLIYNR